MTWLEELILQHSELESPLNFWRWSAFATISAVVKDNIWLDKAGAYKLYPNIYVMLHADSGLKKGPPISLANRLVSSVNNTRIITGRFSIQGALKEMGSGKTAPGGQILGTSSVFICLSELTSSIVNDPVATDILTDLYDRHYRIDDWKSILKMESFTLKDPTVTMLSGTNEAHSEDFFVKKDVQGGYFARTFIIYEKKRNRINSLMFPLEHPPDHKKLIPYLTELSKLKGEFKMDHDTRTIFHNWYHDFSAMRDEQKIKDSTGTLNRFDDSVLKVAMLISLGTSPELIITKLAVEEAIEECKKLVGNVRKTTMGRGTSSLAIQKGLILKDLIDRENHMISRRQLHKQYYLHANSSDWDEIMLQLEAGGHIVIENQGNVVVYRMPDGAVDEWKNHLEGKN